MKNIPWLALCATLLLAGFSLQAKDIPAKPNRLVNDYAGVLSPGNRDALERKLVAYDDSTSTQIAVVIMPSLDGEDVFEYSLRIAETWGVGSKNEDNGVLLFAAMEDRKLFIHTGKGVQDYLTDNLSKRIIDNIIRPAFREGDYYGGLDKATDAMIELGSGRFSKDLEEGSSIGGLVIVLGVFIAMILLFSFLSRMGGDDGPGGGYYRGGHYDYDPRSRGGGGWVVFPGGGGNWGGGSSGGWGGGGGFGGFGGGGFDGGGAGGSW